MARRKKQERILQSLEEDFLRQLNDAAVQAAENPASQFFLAREYNPWRALQGRTDPGTDQLVEEAHTIISLRKELGAEDVLSPNASTGTRADFGRMTASRSGRSQS